MNCPITVTDEAILKFKEFLASTPEASHIRVGIQGGGCVGFKYVLDLNTKDQIKERDYVFLIADVSIIIDPVSYNYLIGTKVGWKDALMGSGFTFDNPQVKTSCGCGESVAF